MEEAPAMEKDKTDMRLQFNFGQAILAQSSRPIITFHRVAFSFSMEKKDCLYENVSFDIGMNARIAILGAKETGKSTLLRLLAATLHRPLKVARYSPNSPDQLLPYDKSPIEYFQHLFGQRFNVAHALSQLRRFGLSDIHSTEPFKHLSQDCANAWLLAQLAVEQPHILLLDEPTNYLDMESVEALIHAIREFQGAVVMVSHDFGFISQVANELWEIVDGTIKNLTHAGITIVDYKDNLRNVPLDMEG
ncbi:P-loop containing nucleoside triphosphate hydrolase protein [Mycena latifolia]|nr:P-loop containing nucleoside triphosphate hydrolase protein [Mycena latifolia]